MMLHLLHGPAKAASRAKLSAIRGKFDQNNVIVFEQGFDNQTILGYIVTPSLLFDQQLIILENPPEGLTNYTLPPKEGRVIPSHCTLVFWFDHEVKNKSFLHWIKEKGGNIIFFPESREISVFPLLEDLARGDKNAFLEIDKLKKGGFDIFYIITMVDYQLRSLTITPKNAPDFVKTKLKKFRERLDLGKIKDLYKNILEIEFKLKQGLLENNQAEFLLTNHFLKAV